MNHAKMWVFAILGVMLAGCVGGNGNVVEFNGVEIPVYPGLEEHDTPLNIALTFEGEGVVYKIYTISGNKVKDIEDWYREQLATKGFNQYAGGIKLDLIPMENAEEMSALFYVNEEKNVGVGIYIFYSPEEDQTLVNVIAGSVENFEESTSTPSQEEPLGVEPAPPSENEVENVYVNLPQDIPFDVYPGSNALSYNKITQGGKVYHNALLEVEDNIDAVVEWYRGVMSSKGEVVETFSDSGYEVSYVLNLLDGDMAPYYTVTIQPSTSAEGVVGITIVYIESTS